jgi:hypothetical protein
MPMLGRILSPQVSLACIVHISVLLPVAAQQDWGADELVELDDDTIILHKIIKPEAHNLQFSPRLSIQRV